MINKKHIFFSLSDEIRSLSTPLDVHLKINYFTFKRTYLDGAKIYLFNHPAYYQHWFEKEYYLIGNREAKPTLYENGYDLWEHLPDPFNLYQEGADNFNIANGLTITRKHELYYDFFFFATTKANTWIKSVYINKREIFERFCDYYLEAASGIIEQAAESKIILPFSKPLETNRSDINFEKFLNEINIDINTGLESLTQREAECAVHLATGKSYKEIAMTFGLSARTVEEHSYNIRQKLHCRNKSELISCLTKLIL
jgi:DNA-binding CsgD family transcriptional regulator